ncbi:hypothetical protein [Ferroacidibacillus organovorans]|uniref:Gcp-like domain-containing protein n=1 Tax=Ferroacidibacillus organovorans TaxID=1765683 RepID=A0A1V4EU75_9BACL|nr:hypothetical protein [Ferroacidibacillus organovorans]OPG16469.1 hypothetical protein B2M26_06210 [Ferroacidibacillus organovorans]
MRDAAIFIGLDTSNYTTSFCAVSASGDIVFEKRLLLDVPNGARGLRQSEALFQHVQRLPSFFLACSEHLEGKRIAGIACSDAPRRIAGSYMPVFLAGRLGAEALALGAGVECLKTSHQSGHLAAGVKTVGWMRDGGVQPFLAIHASGGTTDLLHVSFDGSDFCVETLGSSLDLHVGQFVDRIGVSLGLPFPAGAKLEVLAQAHPDDLPLLELPSVVKQGSPSFSGPLAALERARNANVTDAQLAASVFRVIANTFEKMIRFAVEKTGTRRVLLVGGVASNQRIKNRLQKRFFVQNSGHGAIDLQLCDPFYASDNAYGVALLAAWQNHL